MAFIITPSLTLASSTGRPVDAIVPNDYRDDVSYPLIISLTGYGQTPSGNRTRFGLTDAGSFDDGAIVVPVVHGSTDGGANTYFNHWTLGGEFDYLPIVIADARSRFNIDWVGLVGHSNGGFLAIQFSIQRPDLVHVIATLACAAGVNDPTAPTGIPVPHLHYHATIDGTVPPAGSADALTLPGSLAGHGGVGSVGFTDTLGTVTKSAQRNGLGAGSLGSPGTAYDHWSLNNPATNESADEVWSGSTSQTRVQRVLATTAVDGHGPTVSTPVNGTRTFAWMRANHRTP